jgi:hypothetical protein
MYISLKHLKTKNFQGFVSMLCTVLRDGVKLHGWRNNMGKLTDHLGHHILLFLRKLISGVILLVL